MSDENLLLLDIGNSAAKWLRISGRVVTGSGTAALAALPQAMGLGVADTGILVSSVASTESDEQLTAALQRTGRDIWFARPRAALGGLQNAYAEPQRMGVDRWLAMLAGRARCRGRFCVVDAGSALTIDLVDEHGAHEGGYIIPGAALMAGSLSTDTQRVRFELPETSTLKPGRSTAEAVGHGVLLAQAGAVALALAEASTSGPAPALMICGGGARAVAVALGRTQCETSNLVLEGLLRQAMLERPTRWDYGAALETLSVKN